MGQRPQALPRQPARALAQSKERQDCDDDDDGADDVDDVVHEMSLMWFKNTCVKKNGPEPDVRFLAHPIKQ
jgi:hypothetical protein